MNALIHERFDAAIQEAIAIDERVAVELSCAVTDDEIIVTSLPLLGIPFTCKDSIAIKGLYWTAGLYRRRGITSTKDAQVVLNLRRAGAIPIGLTNVPELLLWWNSYNTLYGQTNNPYDKSRIPGGSSGGEGALIASCASIAGVGSDIGGSIRIPACLCGVFGHKTTPEVVPIEGMFPETCPERNRLLSFGPMTRYACDLLPLLKAMAGDNVRFLTLDKQVDVKKLKVFYMEDDGGDPLKTKLRPEVAETMNKVVKHFQELGVPVKNVHFKQMRHNFFIWLCAMSDVDNASTLAEELMECEGRMNPYLDLVKRIFGKSHHTLSTTFNVIFENYYRKPGYRDTEEFQLCIKMGEKLKRELHQLLGNKKIYIQFLTTCHLLFQATTASSYFPRSLKRHRNTMELYSR